MLDGMKNLGHKMGISGKNWSNATLQGETSCPVDFDKVILQIRVCFKEGNIQEAARKTSARKKCL